MIWQETKKALINEKIMDEILNFQRNEITEHNVYRTLAQKTRGSNAEVLRKISEDELHHYNEWKKFTQKDVGVNQLTSLKFLLISAILGLTFTTKMMENGEKHAKNAYADVVSVVPDAKRILEDETTHEKQLLAMINEEKIGYVGSMVLDVNDALVELTGALAGFTFTFLNSRLIGVAGLITGIAVSLSMAASEYLSQKSEKGKSPLRASLYTGTVYILTVLILVALFFLLVDCFQALGTTVIVVVSVVLFFTFFLSVVKELSFGRLFLEMLLISLGVAAVSFVIGWAARTVFNVQV
jgi:VIT1/CCC1 family predicted Fe2+/Mn2+ transporter